MAKMASLEKINLLSKSLSIYLTGTISNRIMATKLKDLLDFMLTEKRQHISRQDFNKDRSKSSMLLENEIVPFNAIIKSQGFPGLSCSLMSDRFYLFSDHNENQEINSEKHPVHLVTN